MNNELPFTFVECDEPILTGPQVAAVVAKMTMLSIIIGVLVGALVAINTIPMLIKGW